MYFWSRRWQEIPRIFWVFLRRVQVKGGVLSREVAGDFRGFWVFFEARSGERGRFGP